MRILFVCGGTEGGAAMSTLELAAALGRSGDDVAMVEAKHGVPRLRRVQRRSVNAAVKLRDTPLGRPAAALAAALWRRPEPLAAEPGVPVRRWRAVVVENVCRALIAETQPDVVVTNSVDRIAWKALHKHCR